LKRVKKSLVTAIVSVFALSSFLVGCSPAANQSNPSSDKGSGKISVAMVTGVESSAIKKLVPNFTKETGIEVEWNEFDYNTLYEKILNDLKAGAGTYDVIFADDPWMPMFAGGGFLEPLEKFGYQTDDDIAKMSNQVTMWPAPSGPRLPGSDPNEQPKQYGIAQVGNVQLLFYRKDIIGEKAPETWDEVFQLIDKHKGKVPYGYVIRGAKGNPVSTNFNGTALWSSGGDIFDDNWNVTFNNEKAQKALDLYLKLAKTGPDGVANYNADEVGRAMSQGEALMATVWPAWGMTMEDPAKSKVVGKIGYSLIPKGERHAPMIGNWILAIPKGSKNQEAAFKFITWASSKESQKAMAMAGGIPTRISVLTDPELVKKFPYLPAVKEGLETAKWRPRTPEWSKVEDIIGTYINLAVAGQISAKEALDKAAAEITEHMKGAGYIK
jgi:multiple sugar transport system substrate-binding protein